MLVFLDFGRGVHLTSSKILENTFRIICLGNFNHITLIVALSSGEGGVFNDEKFYEQMLMKSGKHFKFIKFLNNKVSTSLSWNKERDTPNLEELKEITGNNPLLLSLYLTRDITIAEFRAKVKKFVLYYISSTFKALQAYCFNSFDLAIYVVIHSYGNLSIAPLSIHSKTLHVYIHLLI